MEIGLFRPGALSGMNSHKLIKNFFTIELNFLSIYYQEEVYYSEPTWELGPAKKASMNLWLEEKEKTPKEIVLSDEAMKNNLGSTESGKMRGVVDRNGWQTQHDRRRQCTQGARQQAAEGPKDGRQDGRQGQPGEKVLVHVIL